MAERQKSRPINLDEMFIPTGFALDLLGRWLFPANWNSQHLTSPPPEDPYPLLKQKDVLQDRYDSAQKGVEASISALREASTPDAIAMWELTRDGFLTKRNDAARELDKLSAVDESWVKQHEQHGLVSIAEDVLTDAFECGRLMIYVGTQVGNTLSTLRERRMLRLDFRNSIAIGKTPWGKRVRTMISLSRTEFQQWLETVDPREDDPFDPPSRQTRLARCLRAYLRDGGRRMKRADFEKWANTKVENLTKGEIRSVWDSDVTP